MAAQKIPAVAIDKCFQLKSSSENTAYIIPVGTKNTLEMGQKMLWQGEKSSCFIFHLSSSHFFLVLSAPSLSYDTNFIELMSLKKTSATFNWKAILSSENLQEKVFFNRYPSSQRLLQMKPKHKHFISKSKTITDKKW